MELKQGTLLQNGKYRIEKVLGQGSFGITYLATMKTKVGGNLGNMEATVKIAIKEFFMSDMDGRDGSMVTYSRGNVLHENYKEKFRKESEKLSKLSHRNIVKILDSFAANNTYYYVMEYCAGGSLDGLIKRKGSLSETESLNYIRQIAVALKYMHDNKMLHLDLKPGNVVLRENGEIVLIDFGLSKQFDKSGRPETSTNIGLGTPGYAPVEQSNYDGSTFPVTMDVYALGGTWFKMLTGTCPPDASTILNQGFPAYELQNKNVSERSVQCIARAMQPLYKDRIQDVGEFMKMFGGGETKNEGTVLYENEVYEIKKPEPTPEPSPTPSPTLMELKQGTLLQNGKYRIVRIINIGGFGCTYEALHTMFGEKVAIKEFFVKDFCNRDENTSHVTVGTQGNKAFVEELKRKFVEEAKVLYKMKHQGIVKVKDIFEENGTAYYVMDYIEGKSLRDIVITQGALKEEVALKYIREVSTALDYVHSQNRLHLDIKPGNIMIDENEHAILIDFGTSKQYDEIDGENTSTLMGKTPGYAPLEQMDNEVVKFYPATDIYALGATLYKMLSGITPMNAIKRVTGGKMESLPPYISEETRNAVTTSMQLFKENRPQSITDFLSLLPSKTIEINEDTEIVGVSVAEDNEGNNDHEYVDLGLPSGLKWATCNVGADSPEDYGDYFAWGEVKPKKEYSEYNYKHVNISEESVFLGLGKRKIKNYFNIGDNISGTEYDAARVNWGGSWRLPTKAELEELEIKCTWKWTTQKGVRGYKVTGPNGNSIFLPAAGYRDGSSLYYAGEYGLYWSSTPYESYSLHAFNLDFDSEDRYVSWNFRHYGQSVRPVSE